MNKNSHSKAAVIKNWGYLLYALPGTVGLLFFYVSPFTTILHYSFTESNVLGSFAGFECYLQVLRNAAFRLAFKNTAFLAFFGTLTSVFAGLILALLLDRVIRKTAVVLTAFLILPVAVPSACTALLLQFFAPGIREMGLFGILLVFLWKYTGYSVILLLAGLQSVPGALVEAARLDGAGRIRIFFMITMRSISPSLFFSILMSLMNSFRIFREVYLLYGNHPTPSVYLISHFIQNELQAIDYARMSSASIIVTVVIMLLSGFLIRIEKRLGKEIEE